jgi:hypothetical protein
MGYRRCASHRAWSGGPGNAVSLWKPEAVKLTVGGEHAASHQESELSQRRYAAKCGAHLMTNHRPLGLAHIFAATIATPQSTLGARVNDPKSVLTIRDRPSKLTDVPAEFAGSDEAVPEKARRGMRRI